MLWFIPHRWDTEKVRAFLAIKECAGLSITQFLGHDGSTFIY